MSDKLTPTPKWTLDCQGKQDYDGRLVTISTRYWPAGGGFHTLNTADGLGLRPSIETHPDLKPSANAAIHLEYGPDADENGFNADYIVLVDKDFEGETEAEVKAQVEAWVQEQFDTISNLLAAHYQVKA
jgi:hypothetical protein